jgi:hypothetical protein
LLAQRRATAFQSTADKDTAILNGLVTDARTRPGGGRLEEASKNCLDAMFVLLGKNYGTIVGFVTSSRTGHLSNFEKLSVLVDQVAQRVIDPGLRSLPHAGLYIPSVLGEPFSSKPGAFAELLILLENIIFFFEDFGYSSKRFFFNVDAMAQFRHNLQLAHSQHHPVVGYLIAKNPDLLVTHKIDILAILRELSDAETLFSSSADPTRPGHQLSRKAYALQNKKPATAVYGCGVARFVGGRACSHGRQGQGQRLSQIF